MRWSVAPYVVLAVPKGFCGASGPFSSSILDTKRLLKGSPHVVPLARGTLGAKPKSTLCVTAACTVAELNTVSWGYS